MKIKTNNQVRELIFWEDLTETERAEFDWIDPKIAGAFEFFHYKGNVYVISDFTTAPKEMKGWDGYRGDSYFSGIVVRLEEDGVVVGTYFA